MKINYKKIASVFASAVMLTSTVGFAAAANYPAPFSTSGGAVVYGAAGLKSDVIAAIKVAASVKVVGGKSTGPVTGSDSVALFTGSTKIVPSDVLNKVKGVVMKSDLPNVLAKGTFSGNVEATYEQQIEVGPTPVLKYAKQPTSDDYPNYGFSLPTNNLPTGGYIYNATVTFNKQVNFTSTDTKNNEIVLFGQTFTIGSGTDSTNIVLYKSSTTLSFDSTGTTSGEATIGGKKYTIELQSVSSGSPAVATIGVTDENGVSQTKDITVGTSKTVQGVSIAVNTASSNNQKYIASIMAGADKINLADGNSVTVGDSATPIEGTYVSFNGANPGNLTKLTVSVAATDPDHSALLAGTPFVDPVFGSFKVDFAGMNIPEESTARENITVQPSGSDKLQTTFTDMNGNTKTIQYAKNVTGGFGMLMQIDDSGRNMTVVEKQAVHKGEYVIVGNEENGRLIKVSTITNNSDYGNDAVTFTDVMSGESISATISSEGVGSAIIGGQPYDIKYYADKAASYDTWYVTLSDTSSTPNAGDVLAFPTIQTSEGGKLSFYAPQTINLGNVNTGGTAVPATSIKIPTGNSKALGTISVASNGTNGFWTVTCGGVGTILDTTSSSSAVSCNTIGPFNYTLKGLTGSTNKTVLYLRNPADNSTITNPAITVIEGKDTANLYNGFIITSEASTNIGVADVVRTWAGDATWPATSLPSPQNKLYKKADAYGIIATIDESTTDQYSATVSFPSESVYAQVYVAKSDATITPGTVTGSSTGTLLSIEDSAVDSVKDMNLIVVGGSCVNKAAAKILGSEDPICGADFTTKTQVSSGQFIIKSVASPYNSDKIAVLVAGYDAANTISAVDQLLSGAATDVGTSDVYPKLSA